MSEEGQQIISFPLGWGNAVTKRRLGCYPTHCMGGGHHGGDVLPLPADDTNPGESKDCG